MAAMAALNNKCPQGFGRTSPVGSLPVHACKTNHGHLAQLGHLPRVPLKRLISNLKRCLIKDHAVAAVLCCAMLCCALSSDYRPRSPIITSSLQPRGLHLVCRSPVLTSPSVLQSFIVIKALDALVLLLLYCTAYTHLLLIQSFSRCSLTLLVIFASYLCCR